MFQMLINLIFTLVAKLAGLVLSPIIALVNEMIPAVGDFLSSIFEFIGWGLDFVPFFFKLLNIPQWCIIAVVSLASTVLVFNLTVYIYYFALAVYNYFKP